MSASAVRAMNIKKVTTRLTDPAKKGLCREELKTWVDRSLTHKVKIDAKILRSGIEACEARDGSHFDQDPPGVFHECHESCVLLLEST